MSQPGFFDLSRLYEGNCSRGWLFARSGDGEVTVDEVTHGCERGLSLQARGAGDGSISRVDLGTPV